MSPVRPETDDTPEVPGCAEMVVTPVTSSRVSVTLLPPERLLNTASEDAVLQLRMFAVVWECVPPISEPVTERFPAIVAVFAVTLENVTDDGKACE
jgi:hypothetical protein